ncbi:MAG: hypothetical protein JWO13_3779 [Acidobacteriales bacterium]|nr:hypothetical protein [Terriglobales bacterium]
MTKNFYSLLFSFCLLAVSSHAIAQVGNPPGQLPPAAQEALNKGILAARVPDYLLALRYFEDARKLAPEAPVVFLNMGVAESKMPGRELRAIAWFAAYLAASPDAANAPAVKSQIDVLHVKSQSNLSRLIKSVQGVVDQIPAQQRDSYSAQVPLLWALAGDNAAALRTANLIASPVSKSSALSEIASTKAWAGDLEGAQKTAELITSPYFKSEALMAIAEWQLKSGDVANSQKTLDAALKSANLIEKDDKAKNSTLFSIASAQAKGGDVASARNTAALIRDSRQKATAQSAIAKAQLMAGLSNPANPTDVTATPQTPVHLIAASDWLKKLDDDDKKNDSPLNTGPFLDLDGYLKSQPSSDDLGKMVSGSIQTARSIALAESVVEKMLAQQMPPSGQQAAFVQLQASRENAGVVSATTTLAQSGDSALAGTGTDMVKCIFYRSSAYYGRGMRIGVLVNGTMAVNLANGRWTELALPSGHHSIKGKDEKDGIEIDLQPGKTYYFRAAWVSTGWTSHRLMYSVPPEQAKSEVEKLSPLDESDIHWNRAGGGIMGRK